MSDTNSQLAELSAMVVAAYVSHNNITRADLSELIAKTHAALAGLGAETAAPPAAQLVPAVPIRKSVTPDAIICLEDGKAFKSLKRHLSSKYDTTPDQYRVKWGLPPDYPMVAPNYAEARSAMAKSSGLGRKARVTTAKEPAAKGPRRAAVKS